MAENDPCENIDNELPPPTPCRITIRTSHGEMALDDAYPDLEAWTEVERNTEVVELPGGCEVERILDITFRRGDEGPDEKRVQLIFTGWGS